MTCKASKAEVLLIAVDVGEVLGGKSAARYRFTFTGRLETIHLVDDQQCVDRSNQAVIVHVLRQ